MVNHSRIPPTGPNQGPQGPNPSESDDKEPKGTFQFGGEHRFLGMTFSAKDWQKLMDQMVNNLSSYINTTFQKMTAKMKKDWKRAAGEDPDD